tara:strand:+ start:25135 stop:25305 length:171 start_codon:yes stop_codon:yes gene_type:complete
MNWGKPMDMWMSPAEQSALYEPCGQAMENAKRLPPLDLILRLLNHMSTGLKIDFFI